MVDPIAIARDRLSKAEAKLQKLEKSLESARSEVEDLRTAVRVMSEITGESAPASSGNTPVRQREIVLMLPLGEEEAVAPASLFETYREHGSDDLTLDTFRTTLWRMKGHVYLLPSHGNWVVQGNDGKYWKEVFGEKKEAPAEAEASEEFTGPRDGSRGAASHPSPEGSIPSGSTRVQPVSFDTDLDDDVPF